MLNCTALLVLRSLRPSPLFRGRNNPGIVLIAPVLRLVFVVAQAANVADALRPRLSVSQPQMQPF